MDIEFERIDDELNVIEYTIRKQVHSEDGESIPFTSFQARIDSPKLSEDDCIHGSFSYYDVDGKFLGVNTDSIWAGEFSTKSPYPISYEINLPEETQLVKCQLAVKLHKKSLWDYAWRSFVILIMALIISAIINLWT